MVATQETSTPPLPDAYWYAAAEAALHALSEAEHVLVPAEFLHLSPRFSPLEYSWALKDFERLAWCCAKDDVDRLAPWLLRGSLGKSPAYYAWSNEVFVLGGNFRWKKQRADAQSRRHLVAWFERVERYRRGVTSRAAAERSPVEMMADASSLSTDLPPIVRRPRVLIVGASGMGNVGDNMLASVLAELCMDAGADPYLSGPDIDPLRVSVYDAVVVGGGGLIYASRDGANETQNLANYLKFGPICRYLNIPVALIGVGDQEQHSGQEHESCGLARDRLTEQFARSSLPLFKPVTSRDAHSTQLLTRFGATGAVTGPDLLFHWNDRARVAVKPSTVQPGRIAIVGEFYRHRAFAEGIADGDGALADRLHDRDFDVVVMSNDDIPHADRLRNALQRIGASASVIDVRDHDFDALVFLFASYSGVITTRFHALVLAALTGVPVLALDTAHGKCARLLRGLNATRSLLLDEAPDGLTRLSAALRGNLNRVPTARIDALAKRSTVHRNAIRTLLGAQPAQIENTVSRRRAARPERAATGRKPSQGDGLPEYGPVPLCWAASTSATSGYANLGDSLSAVIVAALAGRPVEHISFAEPRTKLVAVGSIAHAISNGTAIIWGAGVSIRGGLLARNVPRTRYDIRAIRGPISAGHLRDFGIDVPDAYGDPVWMLPSVFDEPVEQRYELGVIPHIQDVARHHPESPAKADSLRCTVDESDAASIAVINTWHEPTWEGLLAKLRLIRSCKRIVSQSFHGVVIAEAYGIPVLNFRALPSVKDGAVRVDLRQDCNTDPRVWEFFKGGRRPFFYMYSQRRDARTDWDAVIRSIDNLWEPFEYDATPLVESFPLPLAYDPLVGSPASLCHVEALRF